jgi:hypothetical protein
MRYCHLCRGRASAGSAATPRPAPEYEATVNRSELRDVGLTPSQEKAIVAFMKALSDGYRP